MAKRPLIMAHRGGDCFGPENSLKAIRKSLDSACDIIEVDVRRSSDDILFCYHGNFLKFLFPRFFFRKTFLQLREKYPTLVSLEKIVKVIGDKKILFVDIKDISINPEELVTELHSLKQVYIASRSLCFLSQFNLRPEKWKKVCNGGVFFLTSANLQRIKRANLQAIELFWWHFNEKNKEYFSSRNVELALGWWLLPRRTYLKKSQQLSSLWICDHNLLKN